MAGVGPQRHRTERNCSVQIQFSGRMIKIDRNISDDLCQNTVVLTPVCATEDINFHCYLLSCMQ